MKLTPDQERAVEEILRPRGRLGGYGGTGKSVTIAEAVRRAKVPVIVAAPTNKAVLVLRRLLGNGPTIQTLHSMTTKPCEVPERDPETGEKTGNHVLGFSAREEKIHEHVIVDEASMLGTRFMEKIGHLIKSYALVGDPFQLPPVKDEQFFTEGSCRVVLTEVMRQATDSPALAYATELRQGGRRRPQDFGVGVRDGILFSDLNQMFGDEAICITYTNADRHWFNKEVRKARWGGHTKWHPHTEDKVICRDSDPDLGLWRGLKGKIVEVEGTDEESADVRVLWENRDKPLFHRIDRRYLQGRSVPFDDRWGTEIHYGYAVTCHSAQGDAWERVFIVPNKKILVARMGAQDARRWMYTAVTRVLGSGEVTIIQN